MKNLSKGQQLLSLLTVTALIDSQIDTLKTAGFVPSRVGLGQTLYDKYKAEFCEKHEVEAEEIEVVSYKGLPLAVLNDRSFKNSSLHGFVLPVLVTYDLPEDNESEEIRHNLEEDENNTSYLNEGRHGQE